jgi:hypothetical protein
MRDFVLLTIIYILYLPLVLFIWLGAVIAGWIAKK